MYQDWYNFVYDRQYKADWPETSNKLKQEAQKFKTKRHFVFNDNC